MKKSVLILVGTILLGGVPLKGHAAGSTVHPTKHGFVELPDGRVVAPSDVPPKFHYLIAAQLGKDHPAVNGPRKETMAEYFNRNPSHRYHRAIAPLAIAAGAAGLAGVSAPAEASAIRGLSASGGPPKAVSLEGLNIGGKSDLDSEIDGTLGTESANRKTSAKRNVAR